MTALLELRDVAVSYGDVEVLHGLSFDVNEGEIVTLLGSNGAGKTTTIRAISGLRPCRRGQIRFAGQDLMGVKAAARPALGIAVVPEGRELWAQLSVRENLELGGYFRRAQVAANLERVFALFPRLKDRQRQLAGSMSGGEQQMCAIGRAMMSEPRLLMLDEPSLGLSPLLVEQMFQIVASLHQAGMTILLVEQNLQKALQIARRGYVIETGVVKLAGSSEELLANPAIRSAYLGL